MFATEADRPEYGILVHCHLRWDFVWQRPQHILSRLSAFHPILFLEDAAPLPDAPDSENQPRMQLTHVSNTLTVARPLLPPFVGDPERDAEIEQANTEAFLRLLDTLHHSLNWPRTVHWFYTPMAVGIRDRYDPAAVVYDCMDELANFRGAPAEIKAREQALMQAADLVFTGGPSLYAARKGRHPRVYQFNSGVDVAHFQKALEESTPVPEDIRDLPRPILLYYGVIDERMGWDNLAAVADAHPEWSVVLVGPLAKITEEELLRRPNVVYTGQRGYDDLPGYLKGCDVALVPFALSEATRFLSPTKTLEYFAARKPVVSTPIQDIVDHYADAARIAATPGEFVRACEAALAENNSERLARGAQYAEAQTWDNIVEQMRDLLDAAVAEKLRPNASADVVADAALKKDEAATEPVRGYAGTRS